MFGWKRSGENNAKAFVRMKSFCKQYKNNIYFIFLVFVHIIIIISYYNKISESINIALTSTNLHSKYCNIKLVVKSYCYIKNNSKKRNIFLIIEIAYVFIKN